MAPCMCGVCTCAPIKTPATHLVLKYTYVQCHQALSKRDSPVAKAFLQAGQNQGQLGSPDSGLHQSVTGSWRRASLRARSQEAEWGGRKKAPLPFYFLTSGTDIPQISSL